MNMRFSGFEELLKYYAVKTPDAPAFYFASASGEREVCSFRQFYDAVHIRAEELKNSGKTCEGILADGSFECVREIFAANIAGLQVVMLDTNVSVSMLEKLIPYTDMDLLWGDIEEKTRLEERMSPGVKDGKDRILFFTSGTTSASKAVTLTGHSLCQSAYNGGEKLPLEPSDTLLCMLPLGHVFGFVCGLMWGTSCGASVALGRGPRHYPDDCSFFRPTAVSLVPLLLGFMIKMNAFNPELKTVLIGAGDCKKELLAAAAAKGIRVSFGYGLTETSSGVAISVSGDPYAMEICPDDEITLAPDGEILIKAPTCVMQGYYKMKEATDAALKDGVFYSGDTGFFDDEGKLHITGRKKEMLVLPDGTKLFLPEYESAIAAVLKNPEIAADVKDGRPVLIISGDGNKKAVLQAIRPLMDEQPRGRQISDVIFVKEPLPRTATGKIKRWELRQKAGL